MIEKLKELLELYKMYRGKSYVRVSFFALLIPLGLYSPSIINVVLTAVSAEYRLPEINQWIGLIILFGILVFFTVCYRYDLNNQPVNPHIKDKKKQKEEHDKFVVNKILQKFEYHYFKGQLESAVNGVDEEFIDRLTEAEYFLSPKYKLYDQEVEKYRHKFLREVDRYNLFLAMHLYPADGNPRKYVVPKEWLHDSRRQKYDKHKEKIQKRSKELFEDYLEFYDKAKEKMLIKAT